MKRNIHHTILLTFIMSVPFSAYGQDIQPCISPTAVFTLVDGTEETSGQVSGSAPIKGHFAANPSDVGEWTATYEWPEDHWKNWKERQHWKQPLPR